MGGGLAECWWYDWGGLGQLRIHIRIWSTHTINKQVINNALQLHGGYGYLNVRTYTRTHQSLQSSSHTHAPRPPISPTKETQNTRNCQP